MAGPLIAIVGSADPARTYEPPVATRAVGEMALGLGAELARQGCRILVFDPGKSFIEGTVVTGFVEANPPADKSIVVRQRQRDVTARFAEQEDDKQRRLFDPQVDSSDDWEVSFYRALADADGVVLLGGGLSTVIAGQVAIGARIPILALAASGGGAARVWKTLSPGADLPTRDEHNAMGAPWTSGVAAAWVKVLLDQRRRRHAIETGATLRHALVASALFVASVGVALWSGSVDKRFWWLFLATLAGGGAGAAIRTVFERRYGTAPLSTPSLVVTLALGTVAGGLAGMLYLGAQPGTISLTGEAAFRLVSLVTIVSVIGGLTAEAVYRKLLGLDVVHSRLLAEGSRPDRT